MEAKQKLLRENYRNAPNKAGEPIGYGVVIGEKTAERYLNCGSFSVHKGNIIFLLTDGFEPYLKLKGFIDLFRARRDNLEEKVKEYTKEKSKENPAFFAHERSLIAVSIG